MTTELELAVARSIVSALSTRQRTVSWLAEEAGIPLTRLTELLDGKGGFTVADLGDLAAALDVAVTDLVPRDVTEEER
ncbi:hypothetical protein [Microbacterium sp. XT11]|uniref:hypothetical protein n=1 Tax=Microbacterium sp. XT11 TaxID=367477 RepID=UPI00082A1646|nr:hypothetical protein [Microbacterium sp. XT11]